MRSGLVLFIALLIVGSYAVTQEDSVYVLETSNFSEWLVEQEFALVEFYAPWCGHCKNLAPHFAKTAQDLEASGSPAKLAKVDATENSELADQFQIRGYPTLFWFTKGNNYQPQEYNGPREAPGIAQWIEKQTMTKLSVVGSADELQALRSSGIVLAVYGESEGYQDLLTIARGVEDISIVHVEDSNLFGNYKNGDIVLYPTHAEEQSIQYTDSEELADFIIDNAFPPVVPFSQSNFQRLMEKDFLIIAVDAISEETTKNALVNTLTEAASGRLGSFGWMYGDSAELARGVTGAGASGNVFPTIVAINPAKQIQIAFDEELEFTPQNIGKWVDGLLDGTTQPFKKSEPIPENNGPVTTLVAKNFDTIQGKAALVKYYAPWCGHCKTLAPVYEELAQKFSGQDVIIAEIDATANYVEAAIQGFPTLIWYDGKGGEEVYEGGRTLADLSSFVSSKLGHSHDEL